MEGAPVSSSTLCIKLCPATQTERAPPWVEQRAVQRVYDPFGYAECQCTRTIQRDFHRSQRDEAALICILPNYLACQCSMGLLCYTIVTSNENQQTKNKKKIGITTIPGQLDKTPYKDTTVRTAWPPLTLIQAAFCILTPLMPTSFIHSEQQPSSTKGQKNVWTIEVETFMLVFSQFTALKE